jgi:tetratricopeptide (TPR) repeat protein
VGETVAQALHAEGVNMRHLPLVAARCVVEDARRALAREAAARTLKQLWRNEQRQTRASEAAARWRVLLRSFMGRFAEEKDSDEYGLWNGNLFENAMESRFPGCRVLFAELGRVQPQDMIETLCRELILEPPEEGDSTREWLARATAKVPPAKVKLATLPPVLERNEAARFLRDELQTREKLLDDARLWTTLVALLRLTDEEQFARRLARVLEANNALSHCDRAEIETELGAHARRTGHVREAVLRLDRALTLAMQASGVNPSAAVGVVYANLGQAYVALDRLEDGRGCLENALACLRQALGPSHGDVAAALNNLASLHARAGRHEEALACCEKCLDIRVSVLGPDHASLAPVNNNAAVALKGLGRLEEAEAHLPRSVA